MLNTTILKFYRIYPFIIQNNLQEGLCLSLQEKKVDLDNTEVLPVRE